MVGSVHLLPGFSLSFICDSEALKLFVFMDQAFAIEEPHITRNGPVLPLIGSKWRYCSVVRCVSGCEWA
jgi:hypothetical protein